MVRRADANYVVGMIDAIVCQPDEVVNFYIRDTPFSWEQFRRASRYLAFKLRSAFCDGYDLLP